LNDGESEARNNAVSSLPYAPTSLFVIDAFDGDFDAAIWILGVFSHPRLAVVE
jgi:hypothetical protein